MVATLGYLTATRVSLRHQDDEDYEVRFIDFGFISVNIIGTLYFTILEYIQMSTLREQYLRASNLADVSYLIINILFIVDLFSSFMTEDTATYLAITQAVLMGYVFINWLRVFEKTVIYIRLIK